MRKFTVVLLIVTASFVYAENGTSTGGEGAAATAVPVQSVAGSYAGPAESYGLVLELAPNGSLRGNYVEMGRVAVLNAIVLRGTEFTARASFDDGSLRTISGSFTSRTIKGERAFGLEMHNVPVEGTGAVDTFFERL